MSSLWRCIQLFGIRASCTHNPDSGVPILFSPKVASSRWYPLPENLMRTIVGKITSFDPYLLLPFSRINPDSRLEMSCTCGHLRCSCAPSWVEISKRSGAIHPEHRRQPHSDAYRAGSWATAVILTTRRISGSHLPPAALNLRLLLPLARTFLGNKEPSYRRRICWPGQNYR